ncbi:unnamed protein product, partial [Polarella glacialis]
MRIVVLLLSLHRIAKSKSVVEPRLLFATLRVLARRTEMMLKQWAGGDSAGMISTVFTDWKKFVQESVAKEEQLASVKDSVMRFILGDQLGSMKECFNSWKGYVVLEAEHRKVYGAHEEKIAALEARVGKMISHREAHLIKYAEMLGSKQGPVLKAMVFSAWKDESKGVKAELE